MLENKQTAAQENMPQIPQVHTLHENCRPRGTASHKTKKSKLRPTKKQVYMRKTSLFPPSQNFLLARNVPFCVASKDPRERNMMIQVQTAKETRKSCRRNTSTGRHAGKPLPKLQPVWKQRRPPGPDPFCRGLEELLPATGK
jgi:hypothetical protein